MVYFRDTDIIALDILTRSELNSLNKPRSASGIPQLGILLIERVGGL